MADEDTRTTQARPPFETPVPLTPKAKIEGADAAAIMAKLEEMDGEHRKDIQGLIKMNTETANRDAAAHLHTRRHVRRLAGMTFHMWGQMNGSKPPPPPTPGSGEHMAFTFTPEEHEERTRLFERWDQEILGATPADGIAIPPEGSIEKRLEKASEHDLEQASFKGQMIAAVAELKETSERTLALQKEQMGKKDGPDPRSFFSKLGDAILYSVKEREGQKFALTFLAALTSLAGAGATYYTVTRGLPPPPAPIVAPHQP